MLSPPALAGALSLLLALVIAVPVLTGGPGSRPLTVAPTDDDEPTGSLTLAAPDERLEQVADAIVRIVDRHRGIVLSSSVSTGEDASGGGTFSLRVPVGDLSATMRELSALGEVRGRSQTGEDVTASFASAGERLTEHRAERRSLLRRLERSDSASEARAIRLRLRILGRAIGRLTADVQSLRSRT
ncbi:MAG: DUF4349 domain-containing protein, partial [Thermoleophilaceae bacterium]|nr:DUF4349 domain-containing protein [Thermoleophilaceae bacterium]